MFPLLCYSDKDDQLWHDDPYEFIRLKYGQQLIIISTDRVQYSSQPFPNTSKVFGPLHLSTFDTL